MANWAFKTLILYSLALILIFSKSLSKSSQWCSILFPSLVTTSVIITLYSLSGKLFLSIYLVIFPLGFWTYSSGSFGLTFSITYMKLLSLLVSKMWPYIGTSLCSLYLPGGVGSPTGVGEGQKVPGYNTLGSPWWDTQSRDGLGAWVHWISFSKLARVPGPCFHPCN